MMTTKSIATARRTDRGTSFNTITVPRIICSLTWMVCVAATLPAHAQCMEDKLFPFEDGYRSQLGPSVTYESDTIISGAFTDKVGELYAVGSAYLFERDDSQWPVGTRFIASDGAEWDAFGYAVSRNGDAVIIGATSDDDWGQNSGAAYIFRFDGETWQEEAKLIAPDGEKNDHFGRSVAIQGDIALIGADNDDDAGKNTGAAYVFTWAGAAWKFSQKLLASDAHAYGAFGYSVSMEGETALIGAYGWGDLNPDPGAAYVFRYDRAAGLWTETAKITASDPEPDDSFGWSVSLSGDKALIGAFEGVTSRPGSAYIYRFDPAREQWIEEAKLVPPDGAADDRFGDSVCLDGDVAIIGAPLDDDHGPNSGSAYVYRYHRSLFEWVLEAKLSPADGMEFAEFGYAVAVGDGRAFVGAPRDAELEEDAGAVYVFDLEACAECDGDVNGDETIDAADLLLVLGAWGDCEGEPWDPCLADITLDGTVDTRDLLLLLIQWGPC